ncbi:MAG TPA: HlyD family efflux transporter periplasmic adaptor subunit [Gemmataceae bacterium]|jgi:WD40 repeat protein
MFRWIFVCLLLSAGVVAAVWAVAPKNISSDSPPQDQAPEKRKADAPDRSAPVSAPQPPLALGTGALPELIEYAKQNQQELLETIVIPGAPLVMDGQQDVPSEKEGVIIFIGTDIKAGEKVPPEKQLPKAELGFLAVPVGPKERLREGEKTFQLFEESNQMYRRLRDDDPLEPHKITLAREFREVRKLQVGDWVERGQLLALVNPKKSFDEVTMKVASLDAADYDTQASGKKRDEYHRRYLTMLEQNRRVPGSVPKDDIEATRLQRDNFAFEAKQKAAKVVEAQRTLHAALTDLRYHEVHAAIDGVVKSIYKHHQGEAVKPYEPVLQIQDPSRLCAKGLLDIQQAQKLKKGMQVYIEASRPEHPLRIITGHLGAVNCVAVSKGDKPIIVSGSDDETLRGWDAATGEKLWQLRDLKSAVRAAACTPPAAKRNLVLFGTADGMVRLLDLDNLKEKPRDLAERHQGAVNGVAFSPDGERCATCSDDYTICLWKTGTGELLDRLRFHRGAVTSVQFASATRLVSAGRDNRLAVWEVEEGKPARRIRPNFEGRGGDVAQIGVSPDGQTVLFDQGKELRLLSLDEGKQLEGTLRNASGELNFSTMALFSPDGKTILTNISANDGKLQLWRTPSGQARASELRQFIWKGTATCGAFSPQEKDEGKIEEKKKAKNAFVVTGTQDRQVLVWDMPSKEEVEGHVEAHLTLVEKQLDTQSLQVRVWAELQAPEWLIPGMRATMVIPPQPAK